MDNSPLKYLTYDLSLFIYERYFKKTEESKLNKSMLNEQLMYFTNPHIYPEFYGMTSHQLMFQYFANPDNKNIWIKFNLNKPDLVSNSLMLSFLKKHYIIVKKDKKIIYLLR